MAEGGSLPADQLNKDNTALTYQLLECPICLEQMQSPKSLPCLHSFCEECLSTYIVTDLSGEMAAVTSFPCPVCRKITSPVNHSEGKETWAQQFPTDSLTQHFNNHKEMADTPLYCGPCKKTKNQETPALFLCKAIGTLFCEHCKTNFHDVVHEACEILINLETNYDATWKRHMSISCSTHNEKMDCYCEDHKFIGCNKCIITEHRRCSKVMTIKEYCEHQKNNSRLDDMDKSLEKAVNCLESMLNALDHQVESLQQCQDGSFNSISNLRQRINAYLDKKQEEITQEMISKDKLEKTKVDLSKQKCSRLRAAIQNTREASRMAVGMEGHLGMIQLFHRGQIEISACNDLIYNSKRSPKSVSMKHDIDSSHITIDQSSTLTLGRILVEEQPCIIPDSVEYIQNVDVLSNSRAKKTGQIMLTIPSDKYKCRARGVLLMPTGNIIVSDDGNEKLKLFSVEGQYLDELKISGWPHDVCSVDDVTVAVAVRNTIVGIHVVKVRSFKLILSTVIGMDKNTECRGLAFMGGNFMVSASEDIYSVTMYGKVKKVQTLSSQCWYLASDLKKNKTFACQNVSTVDDIVVTRLPNGIQIYGLDKRVVKNEMGVDVDSEGNVYVCGRDSNNVVQVSAYGTNVRELLTSKDGIDKPMAISVCGNKFVVTDDSSNEIHIYQLY
ncbi:tripartite motif-containing protein 2-like [Mizuhopecten yessoensis]|uniref:tripartite motif-containing protein 2-like n=1 Tax=Mizuhopecten yessoensis TaxID=6573 RepID=UPI000B459F8E|nr:tripartite motif-containing protein 2-like [Mizuhopecten yessoensis]XP_021354934.1 tripartite motif-containing protein 2-like [Mizuhopecten yessoensis]